MRGRKPKRESRATDFRQSLIAWKQTPVLARPSLRALACQLSTSHQLLKHYLDGLEKWQHKERMCKAKKESEEIRARAKAEGRPMTLREALGVIVTPALLDMIEGIKREAQHGRLNCHQVKMLKLLARAGFPEAQELLQ